MVVSNGMKLSSRTLPENLKSLFWSYKFENLDCEKDKRLIVVQIINYGNWSQWKWLVNNYGREEIKKIYELWLALLGIYGGMDFSLRGRQALLEHPHSIQSKHKGSTRFGDRSSSLGA